MNGATFAECTGRIKAGLGSSLALALMLHGRLMGFCEDFFGRQSWGLWAVHTSCAVGAQR